ncbi:MAG: glycosylhydrolase-like jelly roll fold domain-containing protein [Limisphaerales bacterium]
MSNTFNWTDGTVQGGGAINIPAGGTFNLITGSMMQRTINNAGTTISTNGFVGAYLGATFNNLAGALLEIRNNGGFGFPNPPATPRPVLNNFGTIRNLSPTTAPLAFNITNQGLVQIQSNRLNCYQYHQLSGTTTVASNAVLNTRGAPEQITLDHLGSLSDSTNPGVKYFSGTATYTKAFNWKPAAKTGKQKTETWLDLDDVQVMAQVKLNGHDLGTLWNPPFRLSVTSALRPGNNTLEIRVANLWPNRMIGDAALPVAERFTWSSYEPFTKDSPLPKSGLLGPVTLHSAESIELP